MDKYTHFNVHVPVYMSMYGRFCSYNQNTEHVLFRISLLHKLLTVSGSLFIRVNHMKMKKNKTHFLTWVYATTSQEQGWGIDVIDYANYVNTSICV